MDTNSFPSAGARIIHESKFVTEYSDGTEEVRFSEAEWAIMQQDPAFGYVGRCGHSALAFLSDGSCPVCEALMSTEPSDFSDDDFSPATREIAPPVAVDSDEIPF